jgi:mRNA-degrading endonuclease RelE of RelBE toxin-antitoxin system
LLYLFGGIVKDTHLHGKPLRGVLHGYWELYFENKFRILYTIDYKEKTVTIEAIKHKDEF